MPMYITYSVLPLLYICIWVCVCVCVLGLNFSDYGGTAAVVAVARCELSIDTRTRVFSKREGEREESVAPDLDGKLNFLRFPVALRSLERGGARVRLRWAMTYSDGTASRRRRPRLCARAGALNDISWRVIRFFFEERGGKEETGQRLGGCRVWF